MSVVAPGVVPSPHCTPTAGLPLPDPRILAAIIQVPALEDAASFIFNVTGQAFKASIMIVPIISGLSRCVVSESGGTMLPTPAGTLAARTPAPDSQPGRRLLRLPCGRPRTLRTAAPVCRYERTTRKEATRRKDLTLLGRQPWTLVSIVILVRDAYRASFPVAQMMRTDGETRSCAPLTHVLYIYCSPVHINFEYIAIGRSRLLLRVCVTLPTASMRYLKK
jgi:hypothetical protein